MPTYEVRRRTVLTFSVVTAANETEARCLARDAWQQDAAIAALAADVTRRPNHDPADAALDSRSDSRYELSEADAADEAAHDRRFAGRLLDWGGEPFEPGI